MPAPLLPAAPAVDVPNDPLALMAAGTPLDNRKSQPHAFANRQVERIHRVTPVYHPPRLP
jgi:hypothetical protein